MLALSPNQRGHPGLSIGDAAKKLGAMWTKAAADDRQPCEKMAAKLKEKHKKHTAAYEAKGEPGTAPPPDHKCTIKIDTYRGVHKGATERHHMVTLRTFKWV
ncbi:hypothetical protein U0070_019914 [Myodes glareolus]|uniref:HMG box domain-containing protein n=1 Tax=Myodes glareolus TaxID=447135 RepID=A0AAW0JJF2_MYOGA